MAIEAARPVEKRSQKKVWWIVGAILLALVLLAAITAFALSRSGSGAEADKLTSADLTKVERKDLKTTLSSSGDISAKKEATVTTQLTGPVESVEAEVGDRVDEDEVLATIDTSKEEEELEAQQASQDSEIQSAENQYEQAEAELEKLQNARAQAATEEEGIELENQVQQQTQAVNNAEEQLASARNSADSQNKSLKEAINNSDVTSPIEGIVTAAKAQRGAAAEGPLFTVSDDSTLKLTVMVKESDVSDVSKGDPVTFTSPSAPGKDFKGKVSSISPVAGDPIPEDSGAGNMPGSNVDSEKKAQFPVEVTVEGDHEGLRIGSTGKAKITTAEKKNAPTIPLTAVHADEHKTYVLVVKGTGEDAHIEKREVKLGVKSDLDAEVKKGLKPGDRVVTQASEHMNQDGQTIDLGEA